ncbi:MAG TPA: hypothetical protein VF813_05685 [Anaerolineaceae bacterium]
MNQQERIAALRSLGYSEREAAFLSLAARHGGYFLRRQFKAFIGFEPGRATDRLIAKSIAQGHVRARPSANQTLIYHIGSRSFYRAIEKADNCNRQLRQPYSVKVKLMGFDYVLAHPEHTYLATQRELLDFFSGTAGLDAELFPAQVYRFKRARSVTRYFVEQFPIFLAGDAAAPVASFCYIDGNLGKPSGFASYVRRYRELWAKLAGPAVIYASADPRMFPKAVGIFRRMCGLPQAVAGEDGSGPDRRRMLEHFRMRDLLERRATASLDRGQLDQLRQDLEVFGRRDYEALYQRWKLEGDSVVERWEPMGKVGGLRTYELAHDYSLFGELVRSAPEPEKRPKTRFSIQLYRDQLAMLDHYGRFINDSRESIIGQALELVFRKDKAFARWRAQGNAPGARQPAAEAGSVRKSAAAPEASDAVCTSDLQGEP